MSGSTWYLLDPVLEELMNLWTCSICSGCTISVLKIISLLSWCFFIFPSFPGPKSLNTGEHTRAYTHYTHSHVHALKSTICPCAHICKCTHDYDCMHTEARTHAQIHKYTHLCIDTCIDTHVQPHLHLLCTSFTSPFFVLLALTPHTSTWLQNLNLGVMMAKPKNGDFHHWCIFPMFNLH